MSADRLPAIPKRYLAEGARELQDEVFDIEPRFPTKTTCPNGHNIALDEIPQEWQIDGFSFYVGSLPGYRDQSCDLTYFPSTLMQKVSTCIENDSHAKNTRKHFETPKKVASLPF